MENWIKTLPDSNPPSWISLPATAERQLKIITAQKALSHLAIVTGLSEIDTASDHISSEQQRAQRVALVDTLSKWIKLLQGDHVEAKIQQIFKTLSEVSTVIGRTLLREVQHGLKVLSVVSNDLHAMKSYAAGESKLTNVVRDLLACYRMASIPTHWKAMYAVATNVPLISWIEDLASRLEHMLGYVEALKQPHFSFSIGKMFSPEAFIIATRQQTAQVNQWSLEDLELYLDIDGDHMHAKSSHDTSVQGLILQGASWQASTKHIAFSDDLRHILPLSSFKWRLKTNKVQGTTTTIPIYINENRKQLVSQVIVSTQQGILAHQWAQRSVAFILQNPIV